MKNIISFIMFSLCFVVGLRAQLNEIQVSYHVLETEELDRGFSLNYYRNYLNRSAIGLKVNATGVLNDKDIFHNRTASIDLVNRWNLTKTKKFRVLTELGVSALRRYEPNYGFGFCGTMSPGEIIPAHFGTDGNWTKGTYFGVVAGFGFDFSISKALFIGMDMSTGYYRTNSYYFYEDQISQTNLRIRIGTRF